MRLSEDVLRWENMKEAWLSVAENRGAPGVDRVSIERFACNREVNLRRLRDLVRSNRYKNGLRCRRGHCARPSKAAGPPTGPCSCGRGGLEGRCPSREPSPLRLPGGDGGWTIRGGSV
ncbi:MAG TPA: hypothetical protein EYP49_00650 [Anaerolineae bacterium]|nr:hypothetical protein [Anaerolineae bacterium]